MPRVIEVDLCVPDSWAIESLSKQNSNRIYKNIVPSAINNEHSSSLSINTKSEQPSRFYLRTSEEQKEVQQRFSNPKFLKF